MFFKENAVFVLACVIFRLLYAWDLLEAMWWSSNCWSFFYLSQTKGTSMFSIFWFTFTFGIWYNSSDAFVLYGHSIRFLLHFQYQTIHQFKFLQYWTNHLHFQFVYFQIKNLNLWIYSGIIQNTKPMYWILLDSITSCINYLVTVTLKILLHLDLV